jgi:uncharacterized protein YjbI with pentapeptide repeats
MKIVKPLTLGMLRRTYRHVGENRLVVSVLGFFELGKPAGGRFLPEAPQWAKVMRCLPPQQPLDEVMPKAVGELIVLGEACAPEGKTVTQMQVRLCLGDAICKTIRVMGYRQWQYGLVPLFAITGPAPFTKMPLDFAHAFGGSGYAANPIGRGYSSSRFAALAGENHGQMPNLEYMDAPITNLHENHAPASLGPIPVDWNVRKRFAGTYDKKWLQTDARALPSDIDWRFFNQAPEDQRLTGWLIGGTPYRLEGVSAQQPVIEGELPKYRVRAFALGKDKTSALRELEMHMDTAWLLPSAGLGVAIWRGQLVVEDSDALDIHALMSAYETGDSPPLPVSHYESVISLRLNRETAALHAFNESQLAPKQTLEATNTAPVNAQTQIDEAAETFWTQSGLSPSPEFPLPKAPPPSLPQIDIQRIASGDFDLTNFMAEVERVCDETRQKAQTARESSEKTLAELRETLADVHDDPPPAELDDWQQVMDRASGKPARDVIENLLVASENHPSAANVAVDKAALIEKMDKVLSMQNQLRQISPLPVKPAQPVTAEIAARLGQQVRNWLAQGVSLAGRDLAGADLRHINLAGQNLAGCLLEYANLSDANLQGADLSHAAMTQAQLSRADFTGADLTKANLCESMGEEICLDRANLNGARAYGVSWPRMSGIEADLSNVLMEKAKLQGACFDHAKLDCTVLSEADISESSWLHAIFHRSVMWKVQARGAIFSRSTWERCVLLESELPSSQWDYADLRQLQASQSNWIDTSLSGTRARQCNWNSSKLSGANLSHAFLSACDLGRADLQGAKLDDGCFAKSIFSQADMSHTSALRADFFQVILRKANCTNADWRNASLYHAEMTEISLAGTRRDGIRLDERRVLA